MYTICNVIRIFNSAEFYKNLVFHGLGWHIKLTKLGDGNMSGQQNGILKIPSTLWNGLISICQYCHGSFFFFLQSQISVVYHYNKMNNSLYPQIF